MKSNINIHTLIKAVSVFEEFRVDMKTHRDHLGAVQAFGSCYELALKTLKRILNDQRKETGSPKDTFHKAAIEKLIDDPELWFEFQKKRSLTLHTYEQENLDLVVSIFEVFSMEMKKLIETIQKGYGTYWNAGC